MSIYKGGKKIAGIGDITQETWDKDIGDVTEISVVVTAADGTPSTSTEVVESLNQLNTTLDGVIVTDGNQNEILSDHEERIQTLEDNGTGGAGLTDGSVDTQHFADTAIAPYAKELTETLPVSKGGTGVTEFTEGCVPYVESVETDEGDVIQTFASGVSHDRIVKYNLLKDIDESNILCNNEYTDPEVTTVTAQDLTAYDSDDVSFDVTSISNGTMISAVATIDNIGTEENGYTDGCDFNLRVQVYYSDDTMDAASASDLNFDGYITPGESGSRVARVIVDTLDDTRTVTLLRVLYRNATGTGEGDVYMKVYRFGVYLGDHSVDALIGTGHDIESTARIYGINQTGDGNLYFPGTIQAEFEGDLKGDVTGSLYGTASYAKRMSSSVGSITKPVYVASDGTVTALSGTVGDSLNPVYLNSGTITACDTDVLPVGTQNIWPNSPSTITKFNYDSFPGKVSYNLNETANLNLWNLGLKAGDWITCKIFIYANDVTDVDLYCRINITGVEYASSLGNKIEAGTSGWSICRIQVPDSYVEEELYNSEIMFGIARTDTSINPTAQYRKPMIVRGYNIISEYSKYNEEKVGYTQTDTDYTIEVSSTSGNTISIQPTYISYYDDIEEFQVANISNEETLSSTSSYDTSGSITITLPDPKYLQSDIYVDVKCNAFIYDGGSLGNIKVEFESEGGADVDVADGEISTDASGGVSSPYTSTICGWEDVRFKFTNVDCTSWSLTSVELMDEYVYTLTQDTTQWGDEINFSTDTNIYVTQNNIINSDYFSVNYDTDSDEVIFITNSFSITPHGGENDDYTSSDDTICTFILPDTSNNTPDSIIYKISGKSGSVPDSEGELDDTITYSIYDAKTESGSTILDEYKFTSEDTKYINFYYFNNSWRYVLGDSVEDVSTQIYDGIIESTDDEGNVTYNIWDAYGLVAFNDIVSGTSYRENLSDGYSEVTDWTQNKSANAILMNDIDLSTVCSSSIGSWNPIGGSATSSTYAGIFDGNSKNISGLYVSGISTIGLFDFINGATIKNLNIISPTIIASGNIAGVVVGRCQTNSYILNCNVIGGSMEGSTNVGGIVGTCSSGTIEGCTNSASIVGSGSNSSRGTGGIVGYLTSGSVIGCDNYGNVEGTINVGGIVGRNSDTITGYTSYSWNTGIVTGTSVVGGLTGLSDSGSSITYYKTTSSPMFGTNNGSYSNCYYEVIPGTIETFRVSKSSSSNISYTGGTTYVTVTLDGFNQDTPTMSQLCGVSTNTTGWSLINSISNSAATMTYYSHSNTSGTITYKVVIPDNSDGYVERSYATSFSLYYTNTSKSLVKSSSVTIYQNAPNLGVYLTTESVTIDSESRVYTNTIDEMQLAMIYVANNTSYTDSYGDPVYTNSNLSVSCDSSWITAVGLQLWSSVGLNEDGSIIDYLDLGSDGRYWSEGCEPYFYSDVTVSADENTSDSSRTALITFKLTAYDGYYSKTKTFSITQKGAGEIDLDNLPEEENENVELIARTNMDIDQDGSYNDGDSTNGYALNITLTGENSVSGVLDLNTDVGVVFRTESNVSWITYSAPRDESESCLNTDVDYDMSMWENTYSGDIYLDWNVFATENTTGSPRTATLTMYAHYASKDSSTINYVATCTVNVTQEG